MKDDDKDRRRHPRYSYETKAWLEARPGAELTELHTINISARGLLIKSDESIPVGSHVKILVELPFLPDPITAIGCVVHSQESLFGEAVGLGMELVAVEGLTEDHLIKFLSDLLS